LTTVAIIQARMGASRLPNKMLLYLHGYPVCEWVFRRVQQAKKIDQVVFALPNRDKDDVLAWYLESIGASLFRGSETDLVERYYQAAKKVGADQIVRVCADNPLICASEIDRLINYFNFESCDYAYNHIPRGNRYPDGLGAEICSMQLLEEIHQKAESPDHREHLFNTIWDNRTVYTIKTFDPVEEIAHPELKLDLDTIDDYQRLLEKPYRINMSAIEIAQTALENKVNLIK
jgi:spore coat polysaccharide biosynthesis protein SpsF